MIGRAARNVEGQVIMYADQVTDSMRKAHLGDEPAPASCSSSTTPSTGSTRRRSARRSPTSSRWCGRARASDERPRAAAAEGADGRALARRRCSTSRGVPPDELGRLIQTLQEEMHEAAKDLRFEEAARLRDEITELKRELRAVG